MGVVFLIMRFIAGGYFAWQGTRALDVYGRGQLVASARAANLPMPLVAVPLFGLMLTIGAASVATGLFPAAGVAMLASVLIAAAFRMHAFWRVGEVTARAIERAKFMRKVTFALAVLAFLLVPQPWPLTVGT